MALFEESINIILKNEGGYVDNKKDPGGATNYGISSRFINVEKIKYELKNKLDLNNDGYIGPEEIRKLNKEDAIFLYKEFFWERYRYGDIKSQEIANKVFDLSINVGPVNSHSILQKSINFNLEYIKQSGDLLKVDGIIGLKTILKSNECDSSFLIEILRFLSKEYYVGLVKKNPNLGLFLKGWLRRASQ